MCGCELAVTDCRNKYVKEGVCVLQKKKYKNDQTINLLQICGNKIL